MTAPQIPDSGSPIWLRLYGHWVRMQGILPVIDKTSDRVVSELTTVDGHRYEQRAPRGLRSWAMDYRYATAAATAAMESAAYDYNFDDPDMRTLLLDTNEAKINMVPPDLLTRWRNLNASTGLVINVGEPDGLPMRLPGYEGGPTPESGISIQIPVRGGITYTATVWSTTVGSGSTVLTVSGAASGSANGLTGSTPENPHQATVVFTPVADGVVTVEPAIGFTAGLMVYEGDCAPTSYRAGRNMPCSISVRDPSTKTNLIWRDCDPCDLPREHTAWVLHEVAMDAVTPLEEVS